MRVDEVRLTVPGQGLEVTARIGPNGAVPTGGVGGWESVPRPMRAPLTVWRGTEQFGYTIHLVLDGWADNASVEDDCRTLEQMGGLDSGDPEPPLLHLSGSLPHSYEKASQNLWAINALDWGTNDDVIRNSDGDRVRQFVTVTLILTTQDDRLGRMTPRRKPSSRVKTVRAKKGDTFEKIAVRELHSKRYGAKLARLNGGRSPEVALKTNRLVRLPSNADLKKWKAELKGH